jgi:hypothetical protein
MEANGLIALPDSYASPEALNRILNNQGYELSKRKNPFGIGVQEIRLIDVFFIAPVLIYAGTREELPKALKVTLVVLGVATFLYNGHHFLLNAKK